MAEHGDADDVPKYLELLNPTLAALHAFGGSASCLMDSQKRRNGKPRETACR